MLVLVAWIAVLFGSPAVAGETRQSEVSNDLGAMRYDLYVPSRYSADGAPFPLVVALHGGNESTEHTAQITGWNLLAEEYGFIVAYPQEDPTKGQAGTGLWSWSDAVRRGRSDRAGSLVALVTTTVSNQLNVDRSRVMITGQSAGAGMAVAVAVTFADLFAAIGVEGGCAYGYVLCANLPTDPLNPGDLSRLYFTGEASGQGAAEAMGIYAHRLPAIVSYGDLDVESAAVGQDALVSMWLAVNDWIDDGDANESVPRDPERTLTGNENGADFTRELHVDANGCDLVERWIISGLGHTYSGARDVEGNNGLGPDMRRHQYEFLLAQTSGAPSCASPGVEPIPPTGGGSLTSAHLPALLLLLLLRLAQSYFHTARATRRLFAPRKPSTSASLQRLASSASTIAGMRSGSIIRIPAP